MNGKKKEVLLKIGDWSFSIYLLHQFVAGIVVAITNRWDFFVLTLCRPWIILAITACIVMVIDSIKGDLSSFLYKKTKRNPMILPAK